MAIEGKFDRINQTLEYNGDTYRFRGLIDTVKVNQLDKINAMANAIALKGILPLIYTSKGIWDKIEDNSGLKDNIAAKCHLFVASWGVSAPLIAMPRDWDGWMMWESSNGHFVLREDTTAALAKYATLSTGDVPVDDPTTPTDQPADPTVPSGGLTLHIVCPHCGKLIL